MNWIHDAVGELLMPQYFWFSVFSRLYKNLKALEKVSAILSHMPTQEQQDERFWEVEKQLWDLQLRIKMWVLQKHCTWLEIWPLILSEGFIDSYKSALNALYAINISRKDIYSSNEKMRTLICQTLANEDMDFSRSVFTACKKLFPHEGKFVQEISEIEKKRSENDALE